MQTKGHISLLPETADKAGAGVTFPNCLLSNQSCFIFSRMIVHIPVIPSLLNLRGSHMATPFDYALIVSQIIKAPVENSSERGTRFYLKIVTRHYNFNLIKPSYLLDYLFALATMGVRELGHLATPETINTKHSLKASLCYR